MIAWVQEFRMDFLLVAYGRPRSFARKAVIANTLIGIVLAALTLASWFLGRYGRAVPFGYGLPYAIWLAWVTAIDCLLSVALLRMSYQQTALLRSYDKLTISEVQTFAHRFKIAAVAQLLVIVIATVFFQFSSGNNTMGYSLGMLTTLSVPAQISVIIYSIWTLQSMERARTGAPRVNPSTKRSLQFLNVTDSARTATRTT
ncbi:uncharacterized protein SPPG_04023 [Spizellomyces punctatus DAOM BR117]|uniref:Uncharacterized protein n=1 Tax=Spizellomyces punctatus (strain DAOM BR117) TaxID=645134 RepID=A0A0L0HIR2_SPIPD|nr:uncharacterized protein SPPG_04023 [Spizellomyces punctatus DAOM BR117]KND00923.1 hypothetical protein SPPG_04023 [Spizellomyces punctatus DAOM BR117]|eukprot:XP_016608962.1 hypothetical protein SPPG_04023 [Spizellomyces punctatus DAOM BR117]